MIFVLIGKKARLPPVEKVHYEILVFLRALLFILFQLLTYLSDSISGTIWCSIPVSFKLY